MKGIKWKVPLCSIKRWLFYQSISIFYYNFYESLILLLMFILHFPIMLTLCLMLSVTHYAQNYAGIIGRSLILLNCQMIIDLYNTTLNKLTHDSYLGISQIKSLGRAEYTSGGDSQSLWYLPSFACFTSCSISTSLDLAIIIPWSRISIDYVD